MTLFSLNAIRAEAEQAAEDGLKRDTCRYLPGTPEAEFWVDCYDERLAELRDEVPA